MSLIYALKAIEPIATIRPIYVCTENAHVLRLHKWNPVSYRQKRMITYLMMLDLRITYIKGCKNVVPDCLSRIFTDAQEYIRNKNAPIPIQGADDFLFGITTRSKTRSNNAHAVRPAEQLTPHTQHQQQHLQQSKHTYTRTDVQPQLSTCPRHIQQRQANVIDDSSTPDIAAPHIAADSADITDMRDRVDTKVNVADRHTMEHVFDKQTTDTARPPLAVAESDPDAEELGPLIDVWVDHDDPTPSPSESELELLTVPPISATHYTGDVEFKDMYMYLSTEQLPDDKKAAKTILLTADHYIIEDNVLYRLDTPRAKRMAKLLPLRKRLCVPLMFRNGILTHAHENCCHYALEKLFLALSNKFYWKSLYQDTHDFVKMCDTCLKAKSNFGQKLVPLNPISPPFYPGQSWSIDHKILSRKTEQGSQAILVAVCAFSGWPYFIQLKTFPH